jgi:hypoxanthine-DNA glycosylase
VVAALSAAPTPPPLQRGLPPVLDATTRVLILGSFPGVASLAARQYYAHPRNHFWPLLGALLDMPLADLTYARRLSVLRAHRIGLWDSIVRCARAGSGDAAIRRAELAEIALARRRAPELERVCFNGKTAARAAPLWREAGYVVCVLPSSSPAYTLPFAEKLAAWRETIGDAVQNGRRSRKTFDEETTARRRGALGRDPGRSG